MATNAVTRALAASRAVRLPASFRSTHQTAGLPGFPATDVFGAAGTPVLAPVGGRMVYVHSIPWDAAKRVGGETAYLQGANDRTYFLTHLGGNVPTGNVSAGEQIGTVGAVPQGWWQPHIHEGAYQGIYNPPGASEQPAPSVTESDGTPIQTIRQYAPQQNLDPAAVLAYALTQGGTSWGAVGDHGTSFGPFQAHIGGAAGNRDPSTASSWANSPAGPKQMMAMMARGYSGPRRGPGAAAYIVGPHFGRGADPASDEAKARAAYPRALELLGQPPAALAQVDLSQRGTAAPSSQRPAAAPQPNVAERIRSG